MMAKIDLTNISESSFSDHPDRELFVICDGVGQREFPSLASMLSYMRDFVDAFPQSDTSEYKFYKLSVYGIKNDCL